MPYYTTTINVHNGPNNTNISFRHKLPTYKNIRKRKSPYITLHSSITYQKELQHSFPHTSYLPWQCPSSSIHATKVTNQVHIQMATHKVYIYIHNTQNLLTYIKFPNIDTKSVSKVYKIWSRYRSQVRHERGQSIHIHKILEPTLASYPCPNLKFIKGIKAWAWKLSE